MVMKYCITKDQAGRFLLSRQRLTGERRYEGTGGILEYIYSVGCIQFDPVDVCGKNAEILLHSRVQGFEKAMLNELLYTNRQLIECFDKNLCIVPVRDWLYLRPSAEPGDAKAAYDQRAKQAVEELRPLICRQIEQHGCVSAREIQTDKRIQWYWGNNTSYARAALETMYFSGELIIHHRQGNIKSYAFAKDHIPAMYYNAPPPFDSAQQRAQWQVLRRIGAVGMLYNRAGGGFLGTKMCAADRRKAFDILLEQNRIIQVDIDGIDQPVYICGADQPVLYRVLSDQTGQPRAEFIAPLDNLL